MPGRKIQLSLVVTAFRHRRAVMLPASAKAARRLRQPVDGCLSVATRVADGPAAKEGCCLQLSSARWSAARAGRGSAYRKRCSTVRAAAISAAFSGERTALLLSVFCPSDIGPSGSAPPSARRCSSPASRYHTAIAGTALPSLLFQRSLRRGFLGIPSEGFSMWMVSPPRVEGRSPPGSERRLRVIAALAKMACCRRSGTTRQASSSSR